MKDFSTFPSTSRKSGTEYASAIERTRRQDASGKLIVVVFIALVALLWVLS